MSELPRELQFLNKKQFPELTKSAEVDAEYLLERLTKIAKFNDETLAMAAINLEMDLRTSN